MFVSLSLWMYYCYCFRGGKKKYAVRKKETQDDFQEEEKFEIESKIDDTENMTKLTIVSSDNDCDIESKDI